MKALEWAPPGMKLMVRAAKYRDLPGYKVIIAGSRTIHVRRAKELIREHWKHALGLYQARVDYVISGCARGVDTAGEELAVELTGRKAARFPITSEDWERMGPSAGPSRNIDMMTCANTLFMIWDGQSRGSRHMLGLMRRCATGPSTRSRSRARGSQQRQQRSHLFLFAFDHVLPVGAPAYNFSSRRSSRQSSREPTRARARRAASVSAASALVASVASSVARRPSRPWTHVVIVGSRPRRPARSRAVFQPHRSSSGPDARTLPASISWTPN